MKRTTNFTMNMRFLIIPLLIIAVCFPKSISQYFMIGTVTLWIIANLSRFAGKTFHSICKTTFRLIKKPYDSIMQKKKDTLEPILLSTDRKSTHETDDPISLLMLRHISLRISEKLKSAYPDATWQWFLNPDLIRILEGETVRIICENMGEYTHADVRFDRYARIQIEPMTIGSFNEIINDDTADTDAESSKAPAIVDVAVWYDLVGQDTLDAVINDLNAKGHSSLSILENGDIVISRNKKESVVDTLKSFPASNYWNELIGIFNAYELQAKICNDKLIVSWV